jgi:hypothetical protein
MLVPCGAELAYLRGPVPLVDPVSPEEGQHPALQPEGDASAVRLRAGSKSQAEAPAEEIQVMVEGRYGTGVPILGEGETKLVLERQDLLHQPSAAHLTGA